MLKYSPKYAHVDDKIKLEEYVNLSQLALRTKNKEPLAKKIPLLNKSNKIIDKNVSPDKKLNPEKNDLCLKN